MIVTLLLIIGYGCVTVSLTVFFFLVITFTINYYYFEITDTFKSTPRVQLTIIYHVKDLSKVSLSSLIIFKAFCYIGN